MNKVTRHCILNRHVISMEISFDICYRLGSDIRFVFLLQSYIIRSNESWPGADWLPIKHRSLVENQAVGCRPHCCPVGSGPPIADHPPAVHRRIAQPSNWSNERVATRYQGLGMQNAFINPSIDVVPDVKTVEDKSRRPHTEHQRLVWSTTRAVAEVDIARPFIALCPRPIEQSTIFFSVCRCIPVASRPRLLALQWVVRGMSTDHHGWSWSLYYERRQPQPLSAISFV